MIRVGIGGWVFAPWRGVFYPPGLKHAQELEYSSRRVTAIEINTTFRRIQTPDSFRRWADETPDDFVFTLKAPASVVNRRVLAETGPGVARFLESGVSELGAKLGPILWQFAPTRSFDEADVEAFLSLLPRRQDGLPLRHAIEVRHMSFADPRFVALARRRNVAIVTADSDIYPEIADLTGDFVYVRLQRGADEEPQGYPAPALDVWAERARIWLTAASRLTCRGATGRRRAAKPPAGLHLLHQQGQAACTHGGSGPHRKAVRVANLSAGPDLYFGIGRLTGHPGDPGDECSGECWPAAPVRGRFPAALFPLRYRCRASWCRLNLYRCGFLAGPVACGCCPLSSS